MSFSHFKRFNLPALGLGWTLLAMGAAPAQAQPLPTLPRVRPDVPIAPILPVQPAPDLPLLPDVPSLPPLPELPLSEGTIRVQRFEFVGNRVLSDAELEAAVAPYLDRPLSFADLLAARAAVTNLYVERGYITSGAYLAAENNQAVDPTAATITLRVVEGRVEAVDVTGDERLRRYVRQRLQQAVEPVLNQPRLEEALRLLQVDPLVAQISATLSSGTRFDRTILTVQVQAAPVFALEPELSNGRSPAVGSFERSISGRAANLLRAGEQLQVGYRNTDGSNQWSASLSIPLNPENTTLSLSYSNLEAQIIEPPFDEFEIESSSRLYQLGLRHPVLQRASNERLETLGLGIGAERIESATTILGQPEPLSVGADAEGRARLSVLSLVGDYSTSTATDYLGLRSELRFGLGIAGATQLEGEPDARFSSWQTDVVWLKQVLGDSRLLLRGQFQLADAPLPALEQFSLGGPQSVRGYRQDQLLSDNGAFASAELQIPLLRDSPSRLEGVPFADFGVGWNSGGDSPDDNLLATVGLGLQYRLEDILFLRLDYGLKLSDPASAGDSLQEQGLSFTVRGNFTF